MTETVITERVRFDNGTGDVLVGDLCRPGGLRSEVPALVVTGSWTTVKEQMAGLYARRLAAEGFISLAFDFTGYGQSAGVPRDVEEPALKASDINAAVSFLQNTEGVDADRLGALAVCASSGYTANNAASDARVKSLGLVAPWLHDAELVKPYYGGDEGVAARIAAGEAARRRYQADGTVEYIPAVSETDPSAAMFGPFGYYLDPDRGAIPEWGARFAVMAWPGWLTYDPIPAADHITQPVRIVHSRDGAVPDGAQAFADRLAGPSELIWTDGGQLDFYDQPQQVNFAVAQMADHFRATL
jgi:fermentation-respiration switch protein FrsA (DUF1100 family)